MDLNQRKLSKSEWESIEVPVSTEEIEILTLIMNGYNNVNIKYNKFDSLFSFLKIEYSETMEDHLYNKYFSNKLQELKRKYGQSLNILDAFVVSAKTSPAVKKADLIRIEKNDVAKMNADKIYEHLLIDILETLLQNKNKNSEKWLTQYFTLYKLLKNNIDHLNKHVVNIIQNVLRKFEDDIIMSDMVANSVEFIEKNTLLLKHADMLLYEHQKRVFTLMRNPGPKLVLYIAPTGTGKTLSPIGISEQYKVIFVCAARHVGLALARAAISVNKKIAFAFGCTSAGDIRLHYFAAKEYQKNKKSGGIGKVDNSIGDKVEIIICDVQSYLPAMYYMQAFNPVENIVTYWDEPTITMDYDNHDLHAIIKKNWSENNIPNVILSSATLPKLHELTETCADFKEKFENAQVFDIISNDCKKSIPLLNKSGHVVLPHYLSADYSQILSIATHCNNNLTLLRYFDLKEVVDFIIYVETNNFVPNSAKIMRHFGSFDDITMQNIKMHYLLLLTKINPDAWSTIYASLLSSRSKRITSNDLIDPKGNEVKRVGVGVGAGTGTSASTTADSAIYVTTKDAYTLTDGPTIFLASDVEKIARFCIQQANIPAKVMDDIMEKIEFNNKINDTITALEHDLEDIAESKTQKGSCTDNSREAQKMKKTSSKNKDAATNDKDADVLQMNKDLDTLRAMIKTAELNETFIPNKQLHLRKWAYLLDEAEVKNPFTSNIDDETIVEIMLLPGVNDSWKILLLMGIGVFTNHTSIAYTEIMKTLADQQKLYMIIASSDYIYGTNYQFCHGYLSKDLCLTQEKIIQALGRVGRNNIQQTYSVRLRDDEQINKLFWEETNKPEVRNMNILFNSKNMGWNADNGYVEIEESVSTSM